VLAEQPDLTELAAGAVIVLGVLLGSPRVPRPSLTQREVSASSS
jgi:hypothetical protein